MDYLFYDLLIAAVLLLFAYLGYKRGFVLTLCSLLGIFVALIGAGIISNMFCQPLAEAIQPLVESGVSSVLQQAVQENLTASSASSGVSVSLEQALEILKESSIYRMFAQSLSNAFNEGVLDAVSGAASSIADYIAREGARTVLFVVSFFGVLLAWKLVSRVLDLAFKLPVLSAINSLMGGVLGFVKGALVVFIAVWLLKNSLPPQVLTDTVLLKFFAENSPLTLISAI